VDDGSEHRDALSIDLEGVGSLFADGDAIRAVVD
jgi:hypothetical protein